MSATPILVLSCGHRVLSDSTTDEVPSTPAWCSRCLDLVVIESTSHHA